MKIFFDVTETTANRLRTGIQRVVREVVSHSLKAGGQFGVEVIPVVARGHHFHRLENLDSLLLLPPNQPSGGAVALSAPRPLAVRMIKRALRLAPTAYRLAVKVMHHLRHNRSSLGLSRRHVRAAPGDVLLLLDSSWCGGRALVGAAEFRRRGGTVLAVIYDVIPITHPQFYDDALVMAFRRALSATLEVSNGAIAISRAVANEVGRVILEQGWGTDPTLPVDFFHLGADFSGKVAHGVVPDDKWPPGLWSSTAPVFMMVGTIEPRKGHAFVLDAFEHRWSQGGSEKLVIIGMVGWKTDALVERILNSPHYGARLFMLNQASDLELDEAYKRSYACIMASYTEGFGLPLIEALQRGVPVLASDLPVFREIAGEHAGYFSLGDLASFDAAIDVLKTDYDAVRAKLGHFSWLTWAASTEQLLRKVVEMSLRTKLAAINLSRRHSINP